MRHRPRQSAARGDETTAGPRVKLPLPRFDRLLIQVATPVKRGYAAAAAKTAKTLAPRFNSLKQD